MADLGDVKAGDLILVPHSTGGFSQKKFYLPSKVIRTTKTQVVVESSRGKEIKYKRDSGYLIGQSSERWASAKYAKPYSLIEDQSDALATWRARQDLELKADTLLRQVKTSKLSDAQLGSLFSLLNSFKEEQDK